MDIASILGRTVPIIFEYTDDKTGKSETIEGEVKEESLTPAFGQAMVGLQKSEDYEAIARELSRIIISWNIDINGEPFPPTFENLRVCPMAFLTALTEAIMESWTGKSKTSKKSQAGSARAAR